MIRFVSSRAETARYNLSIDSSVAFALFHNALAYFLTFDSPLGVGLGLSLSIFLTMP